MIETEVLRSGFDFLGIYGFFDGFMPDNLDWLVFLITSFILAMVIICLLYTSPSPRD